MQLQGVINYLIKKVHLFPAVTNLVTYSYRKLFLHSSEAQKCKNSMTVLKSVLAGPFSHWRFKGRICPLLLLASGCCQHWYFLVGGHIIPISASILISPSPILSSHMPPRFPYTSVGEKKGLTKKLRVQTRLIYRNSLERWLHYIFLTLYFSFSPTSSLDCSAFGKWWLPSRRGFPVAGRLWLAM